MINISILMILGHVLSILQVRITNYFLADLASIRTYLPNTMAKKLFPYVKKCRKQSSISRSFFNFIITFATIWESWVYRLSPRVYRLAGLFYHRLPHVIKTKYNVIHRNLKLTNLHLFSPTLKNYIIITTYHKNESWMEINSIINLQN